MARVQITVRALADLERLFDFLAEHNPKLARERMLSVRRAFELLADHPLLGRQAEDGRRELILSRGRFGYVAKYRWVPAEDMNVASFARNRLFSSSGSAFPCGFDSHRPRHFSLSGMSPRCPWIRISLAPPDSGARPAMMSAHVRRRPGPGCNAPAGG